MIVKLLTVHHLEFLSLKGGCTGSYESTLVIMSNCWKSHVTAEICYLPGQGSGRISGINSMTFLLTGFQCKLT